MNSMTARVRTAVGFRRPERQTVVKALAAALVLGLVAATVWQGLKWRDLNRDDDRRRSALMVAEQQVVDLTTLTPATVKEKLSTIRKRVTGSFAGEVEQFADLFASAVRKSKVDAKGAIDASAVETIDQANASVLIASSAAISNAKQQRPSVRTYRMRVSLRWVDDEWLISGMEFVP